MSNILSTMQIILAFLNTPQGSGMLMLGVILVVVSLLRVSPQAWIGVPPSARWAMRILGSMLLVASVGIPIFAGGGPQLTGGAVKTVGMVAPVEAPSATPVMTTAPILVLATTTRTIPTATATPAPLSPTPLPPAPTPIVSPVRVPGGAGNGVSFPCPGGRHTISYVDGAYSPWPQDNGRRNQWRTVVRIFIDRSLEWGDENGFRQPKRDADNIMQFGVWEEEGENYQMAVARSHRDVHPAPIAPCRELIIVPIDVQDSYPGNRGEVVLNVETVP
jgi:hypothetical protein